MKPPTYNFWKISIPFAMMVLSQVFVKIPVHHVIVYTVEIKEEISDKVYYKSLNLSKGGGGGSTKLAIIVLSFIVTKGFITTFINTPPTDFGKASLSFYEIIYIKGNSLFCMHTSKLSYFGEF